MNLFTTIEIFAGGPGSGCRGTHCGRPRGAGKVSEPVSLGGNADRRWKEAVWKAGKKFPPKVLQGLNVDWTDMPLHGGFAFMPPTRLLVGFSPLGGGSKYGLEHELGHRTFELLSPELKGEAKEIFSKWIVDSEIARNYRTGEQSGVWKQRAEGDERYGNFLADRKRVQEQSAEALRITVMKKGALPTKVKDWAARALKSLQ